MEMTRERLEAYASCKAEIQELSYLIEHLGEGDTMMGNDVILDYQKGYPRPQSVVGFDHEKYERRRKVYEKRKEELEKECGEIEEFVEMIPDSLTRRIFRMYYLQGVSQQQVARKVHMSQSTVSKKIDQFFKLE